MKYSMDRLDGMTDNELAEKLIIRAKCQNCTDGKRSPLKQPDKVVTCHSCGGRGHKYLLITNKKSGAVKRIK